MKKTLYFIIVGMICLVAVAQAQSYYVPDVLGGRFEQHVYSLPDDYHGKVVATLVREKADTISQRAILYIHGYNDYFSKKRWPSSLSIRDLIFMLSTCENTGGLFYPGNIHSRYEI